MRILLPVQLTVTCIYRIMKPFLDADHPSMEDFDIEYLRKWLKNPDESLSYDQRCEYFCRQLDDYVEQQQ